MKTILAHYDDPQRPGLRDTPERVARMYAELLTPVPFKLTTFSSEGYDELILVNGIRFYSLCEHHLVPFFGEATVEYIPGKKILGLSKISRAVEFMARGLQVQERLTMQIADVLSGSLEPRGIGVVLQARHLCQEMRGVKKQDVITTTSCLRGVLRTDPKARAEFLSLAKGSR